MMPSFSFTSPTSSLQTKIEQRTKTKNAVLLLKTGSPKLRELFREKCRIRMKEARSDSFLQSRNIQIEKKQLINQIVREELSEIEEDIELQDMIIKEIMEDCDQWIFDEYEKSENFLSEVDESSMSVFCPVCQVNLLSLNENIITCACGLRLYYPLSLSEFFESILLTVKKHEQNTGCLSPIQFFAEPKEGFNVVSLQAMCSSCDYFNTLIG